MWGKWGGRTGPAILALVISPAGWWMFCFFWEGACTRMSRASPTTPSHAPAVGCCKRLHWRQDNPENKSVPMFYTAVRCINQSPASLNSTRTLCTFPQCILQLLQLLKLWSLQCTKSGISHVYRSAITIYWNSFLWGFSSPFTGLKYETE